MQPVEISRFRENPDNRHCFDCGARMDPSWVSITFAVSLCLNCSGRHRQLGVHVSFVRSLEMDKFTPDQLLALELGGNARAGIEIHKPADYSSRQAVKYSESLKAKVGHALKAGPKQAEAKAPTTSSGAFVYSATGATSAKPAWAK
jgi:recombinational DNA repair protein (RecF pathway)